MLHAFVFEHRDEILRRCRAKVEARAVPPATPAELKYGVPRFLDQLVEALRHQLSSNPEIDTSAAEHGRELQLQGFTVSQVVHGYGDVCQSITDLAVELDASISVDEFRTLNRCLDDAIASAVTEYGRERREAVSAVTATRNAERFGFFAHEVRNLVNTATVAFEVLKTGNVGVAGSTGSVVERSLSGLRELVNRSVAGVRLRQGVLNRVPIDVPGLIDELSPAATLSASGRGLRLSLDAGYPGVTVLADRQVLSAVVANLLQNAFKFTRPQTSVGLTVRATAARVLIEVADECGGWPTGNIDNVFLAFDQRHADRTGLGLGLAFSRWATEENGGRLSARNVSEHGCVFTIDLPRLPSAESVIAT